MKAPSIAFVIAFIVFSPIATGLTLADDGLETFDGTTLDTATWEPYRPDTISQNDELIFTNPTLNVTEYVTRSIVVRPGESVRAKVRLDSFNTAGGSVSGFVSLMLTDNVSGDRNWRIGDDNVAAIELGVSVGNAHAGSKLTAWKTGSGAHFHQFDGSILGQAFILELERVDSGNVRYAVYELDGTLVAEREQTVSLPEAAYIGLTSNGNARFDNVTIPEPSTGVLACLLMAAMTRRRGV